MIAYAVAVGFSADVGVAVLSSASITFLRLPGVVVLAQRCLTLPSRPIKNFSKFHLTLCRPMMPGLLFFIHSHTGSALSPLTSVLPSTGKLTP